MKPVFNGHHDGYMLKYWDHEKEKYETWEWKVKEVPDTFTITIHRGGGYPYEVSMGLKRKESAKLAGLLFNDPTVTRIDFTPDPKPGEWHLTEGEAE